MVAYIKNVSSWTQCSEWLSWYLILLWYPSICHNSSHYTESSTEKDLPTSPLTPFVKPNFTIFHVYHHIHTRVAVIFFNSAIMITAQKNELERSPRLITYGIPLPGYLTGWPSHIPTIQGKDHSIQNVLINEDISLPVIRFRRSLTVICCYSYNHLSSPITI